MSAVALAVRPVTDDERELITRTIAVGATPDELKLYLYDCARQGVHPLDRLIHFTKRSGKYTPITSIDFMRIRAAETGEYAGSDDAIFPEDGQAFPARATVTVWRITDGQRYAYTATARWSEYKPDQNDFMWRKMPHTMLGKCAEALALRKGFPRQLAGLYAKEELDQAEAPGAAPSPACVDIPSKPNGGDSDGRLSGAEPVEGAARASATLALELPPGARLIKTVGKGAAGSKCEVEFTSGERILVWKDDVAADAVKYCAAHTPVFAELKTSVSGNKRIERLVAVDDAPF